MSQLGWEILYKRERRLVMVIAASWFTISVCRQHIFVVVDDGLGL